MAISRLTCPNCSKVLRPTKPIQPGKKVKCPECDTIFVAGADGARQPVAAGRPAASKPAEEEAGAYTVAKDDEDEDKPQLAYLPDTSIKDLRGPAQAAVVDPANKLILVGILGVVGWLALILLLMIPAFFPIKGDDKKQPVMQIGPGLGSLASGAGGGAAPGGDGGGGGGGGGTAGTKFEEEKPGMYSVAGYDLSALAELAWYLFLVALVPLVLFALFAALVVYGGIKINTLESRGWGIAACILAMIPITTGGVQIVTSMVVSFLLTIVDTDAGTINYTVVAIATLEWLAAVGIAFWNLVTLMQPEVIAGFEYKGE